MTVTTLERKISSTNRRSEWDALLDRGETEVFTELVELTPTICRKLLDSNPSNRNLKPSHLGRIKRSIEEGRWTLNGETMKVSKDGLLIDGQHRATGVVELNKSITSFVTFGLDFETRVTVDQGSARKAGDYASMLGIPNANCVAAIAAKIIAYEDNGGRFFGSNNIPHSLVLERIARDALIAEAASEARVAPNSARSLGSISVLGVWWYLMSGAGDVGREYYRQVVEAEGLVKDDPAFKARERLFAFGRIGGAARRTEAFLRGWSAFRDGKKISFIRITGEFPPV